MPRGRPTSDPKTSLVAVRLAQRHVQLLEELARRDGVSISEALRRVLDERTGSPEPPARRPTREERKMFDELFGAFGMVRRSGTKRSRR